ncbi:hypothetical protein C1645_862303 [Glomus cerebriforme]|uniref:Sequence orphan n=1 Tax=Glomus cerebriforme TaxID=658196 RepID=A0A397SF96_9GLOM|nr:hypothetical protein C1645_862303 [Glomus cerebriforme]
MDHDPLDLNKLLIVDCTPKKGDDNLEGNNFQLSDNIKLFQVNFECQITNQDLCNKVEKTFNMAGDIITYSLVLNTPIIVDAKFYNMDPRNLGGATPSRYITIFDQDDQVERFYPQALVKQLQLPDKPATFKDSDITAEFNSLINWHVPDDNEPIGKNQYDLLNTVLHEIIHGLGFVSSWRSFDDAALNGITPFLVTDSGSPLNDLPNTPTIFHGFRETIFDKFIITRNNVVQNRLTYYANVLNSFANVNSTFFDFNSQLQSSPQYDAAKQVLSFSTTKNSLIFMPKDGKSIPDDGIVLETQINPYKAGSSISHVDSIIYNAKNPDFLMRFKSVLGESMDNLISKSGNVTGNAIGPKLLKILGSIGYDLADIPIKKSSASRRSITIDFTFILQIILCIIFITNI